MDHLLKTPHLAVLFLLVTFPAVICMLFTPSLPEIGACFGVSEAKAQWAMSISLAGYSVGQLPYGPLANRFGRRHTIFLGVILALMGSFLAFLAPSFWVLCLARFLQTLGAAVGLVLSFTIINDTLKGKRATRAFSLFAASFAIMPGLSIAAGGWIVSEWGWRGCFLSLTIYSAFMGLICFLLPETSKKLDFQALNLDNLVDGYKSQFKNRTLVFFALLASLGTSIIYVFSILAPYISMNLIHMTPSQFGMWNLFPFSGLVLGSFLARYFPERFSYISNVFIGFVVIFLGTALMLTLFFFEIVERWSLFFPQLISQVGCGFLWTHASAAGSSTLTNKSNGSAVLQFISMGGVMVCTFLVGRFPMNSALLLPIALSVILLGIFLVWVTLKISVTQSKNKGDLHGNK